MKTIRLGALLFLAASVLSAGCAGDSVASVVSRQLLGTTVTITLSPGIKNSDHLFGSAFSEIEDVQKNLSLYDPESMISMINRDASRVPVKTDKDVFLLINSACEVSKNTAGAFDITFVSAGRLWDFSDPEKFTPPDEKLVRSRINLISYRNILLNNRECSVRFLNKSTKIGLGGIAKGYAVSRAVKFLRSRNAEGAIVACAGDIQVIGSNKGKAWRAGIKDPRGDSIIGFFDMYDGEAVSTSGDYERFRIVNGKRYHHIIDPSTGYPADSGLISVSVFSNDPVICDAYSTAFFVLGPEKTELILKDMRDLSVVMVTEDMKVYVSMGLKERITFREDLELVYF